MKKLYHLLILAVACGSPGVQENSHQATDTVTVETPPDQLTSERPDESSAVDEQDPAPPNTFHIDSLFNLKQFKKAHRSSNSSPLVRDTLLHDLGYGQYAYFYFTGHYRKLRRVPGLETFEVITAVHQPLTGEEQFLTIEETLVGLTCSLNDTFLQELDLVGLSKEALAARLGDVLVDTRYGLVFGQKKQIIAVRMKTDTVVSFRYCYLKFDVKKQLDDETFLKNLFETPPDQ